MIKIRNLLMFSLFLFLNFESITSNAITFKELASDSSIPLQKTHKNQHINQLNLMPFELTKIDILEEIKLGEMEMLSQLVQAEAGNQDLDGMRLVADVVLNRLDDPRFPNTIEEVIFQKKPVQFSVTINGEYEKAGYNMSENAYKAVEMEWGGQRLNSEILYFNNSPNTSGKHIFKYGDQWFGY